jgi:integrase
MLNNPDTDLKELRRRLNELLQHRLAEDSADLSPRTVESIYPGLEKHHPEYSYGDACQYCINELKYCSTNKDELDSFSDQAISKLVEANILDAHDAKILSENRKLLITKLYFENEIRYYQAILNKWNGDFTLQDSIESQDFSKKILSQSQEDLIRDLLYPNEDTSDQFFSVLRRYQGEEYFSPPNQVSGNLKIVNTELEQKSDSSTDIYYSEAMNKYIESKVKEKRWTEKTKAGYISDLSLFLSIKGDMKLKSIIKKDTLEFRDILALLPPNFSKKEEYKSKSITEIIDLCPEQVLSTKRVNFLVGLLSSMMDWCVSEGFIPINFAKKLQLREDIKPIEAKNPFEIKDLRLLFSSDLFVNNRLKKPAYFWIPLISLFTGMRLEEISQLHTKDIYIDDDIWIIDININNVDDKGISKSLKNPNAYRKIPIHQILIDIGFVNFFQKCQKENNIRLFSELIKKDNKDTYGKLVGKQFSYIVAKYLNQDGYTAEKKSFHSLRHTFANFYKQQGLQDNVFKQLFGHEIEGMSASRYGGEFPVKKLNNVISILDYGINFSHLYQR